LTEYEPQGRVEEQKTYFVEQRCDHFLPVGFAVALVFLLKKRRTKGSLTLSKRQWRKEASKRSLGKKAMLKGLGWESKTQREFWRR